MDNATLLKRLYNVALDTVNPQNLIKKACRVEDNILYVQADKYDLSKYENIYVLGSGKAAHTMAKGIKDVLRDVVSSGVVVAPVCLENIGNILCIESDHPIPSKRSQSAAEALLEKLQTFSVNDLFIYLLSGGSSSLIEKPTGEITFDDLQVTTKLMLNGGLKIDEMNTIRKHISSIKGGRLVENCEATGIVLTISDVIGDDLYSIGSAPLYADKSSYEDAIKILESYQLIDKLPSSVINVLKDGVKGKYVETPKVSAENIKHYLIGTNALARRAVYDEAIRLNLEVKLVDEDIDMDVADASYKMFDIAKQVKEKVLVFGGENTVKVQGNGKGGRNQHSVLHMLQLSKKENLPISFLSAGTDGIDGNSDAAGAYIDSSSLQNMKSKNLDLQWYLENFDSYNFFKEMDSLIITGSTGTNVMDIAILIKEF